MQSCWIKGYTKIIFEGDNQQLHNVLNKFVKKIAVMNWIQEVRKCEAKFEEVQFKWIRQTSNVVADLLAKADMPNDFRFHFHTNIQYIIKDAVNVDFHNYLSI